MNIRHTPFEGVLVIEPDLYADDRGMFLEGFNQRRYEEAGISFAWVQDNLSSSVRGVVRGLHFQKDPEAQAKLVQVVYGRIRDIVVDIRRGSPSFGRYIAIDLDADARHQILIPRGYAHGFSVLSDKAEVFYKTDNFYSRTLEAGIRFDDPDIGVDWGVPTSDRIVSGRDMAMPLLRDLGYAFE
jgi:dTDP-4-dehydrorhamnose 3,5-epimerase